MNQSQLIVGSAILVLILVVFVLMAVSWRRRGARNPAGALGAPPAGVAASAVLEGLHVGTTLAGQPLERVTVKPLGFRARGELAVRPDGVELRLDGSAPVLIPLTSIRSQSRATWTIDRGVEEDGLNVLTWALGDTELDSAFRMREPDAFEDAVARLITGAERTNA